MKKFFVVIAILIFCLGVYLNFLKPSKPEARTLTFWSIQLKPVYEKQLNKIIKDFEQEFDIKVVWVDIPIAEAQKRTLASILSSSPPDLVNLNPEFSLLLAQRGALQFFKESEVRDFEPSLVDILKYEGKIYALPFYATSAVTIYNTNYIKKAPLTYDDIYMLSENIKKNNRIPSFAANLNENDTLARILNKYNISNFSRNREVEDAIEIYKMFDYMYKEGYLPKDVLVLNHREMIEKYMAGGAASIVAGSNFIKTIKENAPDIYKKSLISKQLTGANGRYDASLMNLIIPYKSKNKALAYALAQKLTSKENQLELAHLTNVLPANRAALQNDFFKNCSEDLVDAARCVAAEQLKNLNNVNFGSNNKKTINEAINKTLEEILLDNKDVKKEVEQLSEQIKQLQEN